MSTLAGAGGMTCYPMPAGSNATDITVGPVGTHALFDVSGGFPISDDPFPHGIRTASAKTLLISIQEMQTIVTIRAGGSVVGRFTVAGGLWLEFAPGGLIAVTDTELLFFNPAKNAAGYPSNSLSRRSTMKLRYGDRQQRRPLVYRHARRPYRRDLSRENKS